MFDTSELFNGIPGLVHGFTDRAGGVSVGPYATLNMGGKWGDAPEAVAENRRRVGAAAGFAPERLRLVRQVHGADVLPVAQAGEDATADGLWCRRAEGVVVGVLTADCVPVLLADRAGRVAAAVHAGWRGTVAGVVPAAVTALLGAGIVVEDLCAVIGPCIGFDAFEVGPDVAARFPADRVRIRSGRPRVDLAGVVHDQLCTANLRPEQVGRVGGCTYEAPQRWYSYRRDGAGIGQMLAFIGFAS